MPSRVFMICNAYESGFGHGLANDGLDRSKTPHSDPELGEAYQLGYEQGLEHRDACIPPEVLDLVRFMCATWAEIDGWAVASVGTKALCKYPIIQGLGNQIALRRIGEQEHNGKNVRAAMDWMLNQSTAGSANDWSWIPPESPGAGTLP